MRSYAYVYSSSPGRHTANATVWIAVVTMLATLDFNPATDADGNDIIFEAEYMNGATRCVAVTDLDLDCDFDPCLDIR